ncbi:MAG TPA: beta-galactosidase [Candidatus Acidoferrum sp.]|nr:beta-galactosidase [Candidatus Acidoferrum sp.]
MLTTIGGAQSRKEKKQAKEEPPPTLGVQLEIVNGYPEIHVDGHPFFVHAAEFDYYRIPRDLWSDSLDRYRDLGINTIDIRIPWNWHEPIEGNFDFDGHSNPRRDLRGLLKMIAEKGFRLIARPGPFIGHEWRDGGYPDRFRPRPGFQKIAAGCSPSALLDGDTDAVTVKTETPLQAKWLLVVAHELAPYNPSNPFTISLEPPGEDKPKDKKVSGPLLFVFLDDLSDLVPTYCPASVGLRMDRAFRDALLAGGIKPGFEGAFVVSSPHVENGFVYPSADLAATVAGEWFLEPNSRPHSAGDRLDDFEADTLALLAQSLRMQTGSPPMIGSFQAGWDAPPDDTGPPASAPENTLLASRWLIGQGITGIEYSPLQDTLTPPGFQSESANRDFRWDAALNLNGTRQPRAHEVQRNARMLATWGEFLATSHPRAEIGIVDVRDASANAEVPLDAAAHMGSQSLFTLRQIERVTSINGYSTELVDPEHQPVESLLRDPLLLLPIPIRIRGQKFLSEKAQNALLDYVRRGGTLVCEPVIPAGAVFDQALGGVTLEDIGKGLRAAKIGDGKIIELEADIFSWVSVTESFAASIARPEAKSAAQQLQGVIAAAGSLAPIVSLKDHPGSLLVSELAANPSAGELGAPTANCGKRPRCAAGLVSVTNWSGDDAIQDTLAIVPPASSVRTPKDEDLISLPVEIPPHESLLLPINIPLCPENAAADSCSDKIVAAGAEFLGATRSGNALDLLFYAPAKATVLIKLESRPLSVELPVQILITQDDKPLFPERSLEGHFNLDTHVFRVEMPRGAAPDFIRDLRLHLDYTPNVPERPKASKHRAHDFRYSIVDAVRLPLGHASLATEPPLIALGADGTGRLVVQAESKSDSWITMQAVVEGAARGSERLHLEEHDEDFATVNLTPTSAPSSPPDPNAKALLPGTLSFTGDKNIDKKSPLTFLFANGDDPVGYEYDFERSGSRNWVLENKNVRLILLPDAGGEIEALVEKSTGANLTTNVGGLRDLIRMPSGNLPEGAIIDPTLNLPYHAQWDTENGHPAISLEATFPEWFQISGNIKKIVHLETKDGMETVDVRYLPAPIYSESKANESESARPIASIVTAFSVPAVAQLPDRTQFCWFATSLPEKAAADSAAANPSANAPKNRAGNPGVIPAASPVDAGHCTAFAAGGATISLPAGAKRVEVRTEGQPTLVMEWDAGSVSIEQKQFSARLLLELPAISAPGNDAGVRLRYTILHTQ